MTEEQIKHIAGAVGSGIIVFVNISENTITEISDLDFEDYQEHFDDYKKLHLEIDQLVKNPAYLKITQMSSKEYKTMVKDFIALIEDKDLRKKLSLMIDRKNGMATFRDELEYDDAMRRTWFLFKAQRSYDRIEQLLKVG